MDKRVEKLEKLKENIKNPDFRKAVEDKIEKIKGNKTIAKDGY